MRVFLGLGSNSGDRLKYLQTAVNELRRVEGVSFVRASRIYETEPMGMKNQPVFLNAVVEIESDLDPADLLRSVKALERWLGRTQSVRWGPREIDIDIIYFGDLVVNRGELRVPHPEAPRRRFVLVPLTDIAPGFTDPLTGMRMIDLLDTCPGSEQVVPVPHTLET